MHNSTKESSIMIKLAWVLTAIGVLICSWNVSDFSDQNLTLMVGIGFIVAAVQIALIGLAVELFQGKTPRTFP
ncbi:hypothetical protein LJK88_05905 [Paenibacillus sp. P26]|nr:hypothetical protein LJK88_05905 [Paenibacillus sp. P26]UUZ90435.1 hypothetical protein LJK87_31600 [Paenibacillus sp. P25]